MVCKIQGKVEQKQNGRQSYLGMLLTMTVLKPQIHNVTLACDDSRSMQTHKVMLVDISPVSGGLLRKHTYPYPIIYVSEGQSPSLRIRKDRGQTTRKHVENILESKMSVEVPALMVQPPWPPGVPLYCYALLAQLPWPLQLFFSALLAQPPWPPIIGRHGSGKAW